MPFFPTTYLRCMEGRRWDPPCLVSFLLRQFHYMLHLTSTASIHYCRYFTGRKKKLKILCSVSFSRDVLSIICIIPSPPLSQLKKTRIMWRLEKKEIKGPQGHPSKGKARYGIASHRADPLPGAPAGRCVVRSLLFSLVGLICTMAWKEPFPENKIHPFTSFTRLPSNSNLNTQNMCTKKVCRDMP
jgi:hypothetical protein